MSASTLVGLYFLATVCMMVEIVLVPGIGLAGVLSFALFVWAGVEVWDLTGPWGGMLSFILSAALGLGSVKWVGTSSLGKKMVLDKRLDDSGETSEGALPEAGRLGRVQSPLRPSGILEFNGRRVGGISDTGQWIEKGVTVRVTGKVGGEVRVRPVANQSGGEPPLNEGV